VGQAQHAKVSPVQGEHDFDRLPVCQVHQRRIGKLYTQALVFDQNRGDAGQIRLAQRNQLKGPATERGQESSDRQRVRPQKPGRFGNHGPTSQKRTPDAMKLRHTSFVMLVGFRQDGHNRARIYQYAGGLVTHL